MSRSANARRRWWISTVVAGAGGLVAAYFLDPKLGRSRRRQFAARTSHLVRQAATRVGRESRYLGTTAYRRTLHWLQRVPARTVEGRTLLDRVESELFANPGIPHGRLNLEVEGTTVVLRGQLDSQAAIAELEEAVRQILGVGGVKNLLHLTGTPAPNKVAALRASAQELEYGAWPHEAPPDVDSER